MPWPPALLPAPFSSLPALIWGTGPGMCRGLAPATSLPSRSGATSARLSCLPLGQGGGVYRSWDMPGALHKHIPHIIARPARGIWGFTQSASHRQLGIDLGNPCSKDDTASLEIPKYPGERHWGRWQEPYLACWREGKNSWVFQHLSLPAGNQTGTALAIGSGLVRLEPPKIVQGQDGLGVF